MPTPEQQRMLEQDEAFIEDGVIHPVLHWCSHCGSEVGKDYTLCIEICCVCKKEGCQHDGGFTELAEQEDWIHYECQETDNGNTI